MNYVLDYSHQFIHESNMVLVIVTCIEIVIIHHTI
jgi:hypothetical protein